MNWGSALLQLHKRNKSSVIGGVIYHASRLRPVVLFACLLLVFFNVNPGFAKQDDSTNKLIEYLAQEKINLTLAINEAKQLSEPTDKTRLTLRKQQNKALLVLLQAKITGLENFQQHQLKQQQSLSASLKKIQQSPLGKSEEMQIEERMSQIDMQNALNEKSLELIGNDLELAHQYQAVLTAESHQLDLWQSKLDLQHRLEDLHRVSRGLQKTRNALYFKNVELQQPKNTERNFDTIFSNEAKILLNNQSVILIQYQITALDLQKRLLKADYLLASNPDIKTLQTVTDTYKNALSQLLMVEQSLKKMIVTLKNQQLTLSDHALKQQFLAIKKTASLLLEQVEIERQTLQTALENKQLELKKQLSARQGLIEYQPESWPSIINQLLLIPSNLYHYVKSLALKVRDNYLWQDGWQITIDWVGLVLILVAAYVLTGILRQLTQDKQRQRLSAQLYDGALVLIYRNVPQVTFLAILLAMFSIQHIAYAKYQLLINLILVFLTFRSLILIARLALLERIDDSTGQDARLYYRLKWLLLFGGWSTALMVFSHQFPSSLLLQDFFNRLFMLFLLAVALVIWKSKDVIPYLLRPLLKTKKRYFRHAMSLLVMLVPLILFTTAIIGLVGYIHLAWTMSRYQAYTLLVITCYVLARGLILDVLELLSEWMISALHNGWLWIEVFLKPLDKILRVLLFVVSIIALFQLFGWYSDSFVMTSLKQLGRYPLVDVSGVHITLFSIIKFFLLLFILIWAAKWTREFCYRWLYRKAKDAGIRNSFSVFTQYAVILMGGFITLRVLGLDFSGMSMVLGGLAVGMGFGLRDFASNIVGGVMLLIERPVREGDLITLGEYEGRVAHIGIRSMRVSSWDNMEVLIPNAETFNKPFTNWTHQDSVVRTVVPIKVSRADDPALIQQLILDVLISTPEILADPPPQVFLKQIDDALIEFEARYFINVQLYTRFEVRSQVLFAIMAQFKAAGVKPPIPPFSVEIKEGDSDSAISSQSTEKRD